MDVLEAIEKLKDIQSQIESLVKVIMKLESDKDFNQEIRMLNAYKNELHSEYNQLEKRLENTQLINISNTR